MNYVFSSNKDVFKIKSEIDINVKYIYLNVFLFQCQLATKIIKWMYFIAFSICKKIRFKIVSFRRMNWLWQFYYNVVPIPYAQKKNCLYLVSTHFFAYSNPIFERMSRFAWYAYVKMQKFKHVMTISKPLSILDDTFFQLTSNQM